MYAPFIISGILWHEIGDKIAFTNTVHLKELLNKHLNLSDYGTGLLGISFLFIVMPNDETIHRESFTYYARKKALQVQMRLPYNIVEAASPVHLMAEKYLHTLQTYLPKRKILDFDWKRFVQDVQAVLEQSGCLAEVASVSFQQ
jgi:hypothetical protein